MQPRGNRAGFTLLEIVLSITILALIALVLSRIFSESSQAVNQGRNRALLDETARLVLDNIEQDIGQALIRTNLPFRVYNSSGRDELYFISPAVRRRQSTNPRDTAPVRLRTARRVSQSNGLAADLNRYIQFKYPTGIRGKNALRNLLRQSNAYRADAVATDGSAAYTEYLESSDELSAHAALTFLDLVINGNVDSNRGRQRLPTPADRPRFVDAVLGLVSATDLEQAMRLYRTQGEHTALEFLAARESVYTRRIFMPNAALEPGAFQP